jgi:DNA mismatch repair ATPase MutS/predicted GIY-YIG superfamily endonuclease
MKRRMNDLDKFIHVKKSAKVEEFSEFWKSVIFNTPRIYHSQIKFIERHHGCIGVLAQTSIPKLVEKYTQEYDDHIVCIQNGDFYNFFGIHALALFTACGVNSQGGRAEGGFPISSAPRYFARLTALGFRLCVIDQYISQQTGKIERKLMQIISPANPAWLFGEEIEESTDPKPVVVYVDSVMTILNIQSGTILYRAKTDVNTLVSTVQSLQAFQLYVKDRSLFRIMVKKLTIIVSFTNAVDVVSEAFRLHFVKASNDNKNVNLTDRRRPLTFLVAQQLGLVGHDRSIPSLTKAVLGSSKLSVKRTFQKWIINNVGEKESHAMKNLVKDLMIGKIQVLSGDVMCDSSEIIAVLNNGKLYKNGAMFVYLVNVVLNNSRNIVHEDLRLCAISMIGKNNISLDDENKYCEEFRTKILSMMKEEESELTSSNVVATMLKDLSSFKLLQWENKEKVHEAVLELQDATNELYSKGKKVSYNEGDQVIQLEQKQGYDLLAVITPKGKIRNQKFTTHRLSSAITYFKQIVEKQKRYEETFLKEFSLDLLKKCQQTLMLRVTELLLKTTVHTMTENTVNSGFLPNHLLASNGCEKLFPYWLNRPDERCANDIDMTLHRTTLITAPNMAGKTTALRSILAAAVLNNAGLCVPAKSFHLPHFDNFFIRFPAVDDPVAKISSFEAEVIDVADILKNATYNSLVMLDEIGRGTSYTESRNYANALIQELNSHDVTTFFATHLFILLDLEPEAPRFTLDNHRVINGGECRNSRAIDVLVKHMMPETICRAVSSVHTINPKLPPPADAFLSTLRLLRDIIDINVEIKIYEHNVLISPGLMLQAPAAIYVLQEHDNKIYIGESYNVLNRREEHAKRDSNRKECKIAVAMLRGGKTESLKVESQLQRACIAQGIPLSSTVDANHH